MKAEECGSGRKPASKTSHPAQLIVIDPISFAEKALPSLNPFILLPDQVLMTHSWGY
jgi:hypothetical protein